MAAALPMGKVGLEPTVFTAWVADLQSAAIAAMLTCPYYADFLRRIKTEAGTARQTNPP